MDTPLAYLSKLRRLSPAQRLHLSELLAHNLTIAIRAAWSEPSLSCEEKLDSIKHLNECLHRVTARVWVQRLNTHTWTDEDFLGLLSATAESLHPKLRGEVLAALASSYAKIAN